MKAIDTNILVRLLIHDTPHQSQLVSDLFVKAENDQEQLYVSLLVLMETVWVLRTTYKVSRMDAVDVVEGLTAMPVLTFESLLLIQRTIELARAHSADFADILIGQIAIKNGAESILTFDKKAAKLPSFTLLAEDD